MNQPSQIPPALHQNLKATFGIELTRGNIEKLRSKRIALWFRLADGQTISYVKTLSEIEDFVLQMEAAGHAHILDPFRKGAPLGGFQAEGDLP